MEFPRRKVIRLKNHDYSQNAAYFVTICVKDGHELLGQVVGTTAPGRPFVELTMIGQCVEETIQKANKDTVQIEKYVIMPNHIHLIVKLRRESDDRGRSSLQQVVRNIKSFVTKRAGFPLWQDRFHDHVIRSESEYQKIWQYIDTNAQKWEQDCYHREAAVSSSTVET